MHPPAQTPIAILGAGSWGTALALYLGRLGQAVRLWSIEPDVVTTMQQDRINKHYHPHHHLPATIQPTANLEEAITGLDDIVLVIPSMAYRQTITTLQPWLTLRSPRLLCATKGMDAATGQLLHAITAELLSPYYPFAILSGPSFAYEVAAGLPTAAVIASTHPQVAQIFHQRFHSPLFNTMISHDVIGVEVGGIVKNILAIASGLLDGMELGANARSVCITYGLTEMIRLTTALGGNADTCFGLSGLGDLILTCTDNQSRNRQFGLLLGQHAKQYPHHLLDLATRDRITQRIGRVIEGAQNAQYVAQVAQHYQLDLPICQSIYHFIQGDITAETAVTRLFTCAKT